MKTIIISVLFTTILLMSCGKKEVKLCDGFKLKEPTLTDDLDYEIINTILDSIYGNFKFIHINQKTSFNVNIENLIISLQNQNIEIDTLLISNYKSKNDINYFLSNKFEQKNVQLVTDEELECLLNGDDDIFSAWDNYYKKYPISSGNYIFYRPGFNINNDVAIIEYEWYAGPETGEAYIVLLEKQNNKWKIIHYFVTSAS